ncbi:MAG: hypothetical protein ACAI35_25815 [Candidatus Methylacidiphilales bacterium]|nr:hypothetical protein [Candidatus Methylacidiphilales bacterium]
MTDALSKWSAENKPLSYTEFVQNSHKQRFLKNIPSTSILAGMAKTSSMEETLALVDRCALKFPGTLFAQNCLRFKEPVSLNFRKLYDDYPQSVVHEIQNFDISSLIEIERFMNGRDALFLIKKSVQFDLEERVTEYVEECFSQYSNYFPLAAWWTDQDWGQFELELITKDKRISYMLSVINRYEHSIRQVAASQNEWIKILPEYDVPLNGRNSFFESYLQMRVISGTALVIAYNIESVAIAVTLWKHDHGTMPDSLEAIRKNGKALTSDLIQTNGVEYRYELDKATNIATFTCIIDPKIAYLADKAFADFNPDKARASTLITSRNVVKVTLR